jgi:Rv0078B-related antitoxin
VTSRYGAAVGYYLDKSRSDVLRLRLRGFGFRPREWSPEAKNIQAGLALRDFGVRTYRYRVRAEHPGESRREIRARVAAWQAQP